MQGNLQDFTGCRNFGSQSNKINFNCRNILHDNSRYVAEGIAAILYTKCGVIIMPSSEVSIIIFTY